MKRVCIHQPDFLPYLGFFHRLLFSNVFIILDDVQFIRRGWHHRDKIKTKCGETWLTLSVKKDTQHQKINQVTLSKDSQWITKNLNLIQENYRQSTYFHDYFPLIEKFYRSNFVKMVDLNMKFLYFFFEFFELKMEVIFSSTLNVTGQRNQKLINLITAIEGTHYLSGIGAKTYLDEQSFTKANIIVEWQQFQPPIYPQLYGEFIPNLSCIDLLFNCGPYAKDMLWSYLNRK